MTALYLAPAFVCRVPIDKDWPAWDKIPGRTGDQVQRE
jgi:hypothetical protein